jgi:hypothetical protein
VQTFLPLPDFDESARVLDRARLGSQRLEALEILCIITKEIPKGLTQTGLNIAQHAIPGGWRYTRHKNHPACLMWAGYHVALKNYYMAIVEEWERRGYSHNLGYFRKCGVFRLPPWYGHSPLHISHQSRLIQKNPAHYRPHFPEAPDDLEYYWPTKEGY